MLGKQRIKSLITIIIFYTDIFINEDDFLYPMEGIGLKVKVRAVPSRGRARVHESVLEMLEIEQGDHIDLYSAPDAKPMTVSVYADAMVDKGIIRMDTGDVEKLGLREESVVTAKKTPTFTEKLRSTTSRTTQSVGEGVSSVTKKITGKKEESEESEKPEMKQKPA
jgi:hypothetical protein